MVSVRDNVPFPYRLRTEERIAKSTMPIQDTTHPGDAAIHAGIATGVGLVAGGIKSMATPKPEDNPDTTGGFPLVNAIKTVGKGVVKVAGSMATAYAKEKNRSVPNNNYDPYPPVVGPTTGGYGPTTGGYGPTTGGYGPTKSFSKIENEENLEKFWGTLANMAGGALITQLPKLLPRIASFVAGRAPGIAAKVATQAPGLAAGITNYAPKVAGAMNTVAANPKFGQAAHLVGTHLAVGAGLDYLTNKEDDENNKSFISRKTNPKNTMRKSEDVMPYDINKVVRAQVINETELDKMGGGSLSVVFYEKKKDGKNRKIKKSVSEMSLHEFYELLNKAEIPTRQMAMTEGSRAGNIPTELVLGGVLGHGDGGQGWFDGKDEHGRDLASKIVGNSSAYQRPKLSPHSGKPILSIDPVTNKPYKKGHPDHGKVEMETVAPGGLSSTVSGLMGTAAIAGFYPKITPKIGPALTNMILRAKKFIP